ncbi:hypothetical protein [Sporosarcina sp. BP05]|uniref:hypothetical protein n=1 Tax=Sporosarcina sp. BP05 TaxID=2758726 RepID=UPI0016466040|nr:hypothetical protein [Sporosarcina sp. BP05]
MIKNLNRYGEIDFKKNEGVFSIPLIRLKNDDVEVLEENYQNRIKELGYVDTFLYANHMSLVRDRLQMSFDLSESVDFHHLQQVPFENKLNYFKTMVEIASVEGVLWEKNNFVVDLNEKRVKALLFYFEGFEVYKKDSALDGLKQILLLSLTKLNRILGKPKRADFIEQEEIVIRFAEDLLRANSVGEISSLIEACESEIEYEKAKLEEEMLERQKNNKFSQFRSKFNKPKKELTPEEQMKKQLSATTENDKPKKGLLDKITSPKGMVGTIVAFGLVFLIYSVTVNGTQAQDNEIGEVAKQEAEAKQQKKVIEAYRSYINGGEENINNAYGILEGIGYENLSKKDKAVLIDWLIEQKQFSKAVATDNEASYKVGAHLATQENGLEELEKLKTSFDDNKVIAFDVASLKNQYQVVLDNKDIHYNERRAKKLVEAFAMNNQIDELRSFMDSIKEDDRDSYENLLTFNERYSTTFTEKRKITDELDKLKAEVKSLNEQIKSEKGDDKKKSLAKQRDEKNKEIETINNRIKQINESIKE